MSHITEAIFTSVKIAGAWKNDDPWEVLEWVRAYLDLEKPHMVVQHLHGKREQKHWHVVGVKLPDVDHLQLDKVLQAPHPLRKEKRKPFQTKNQLYDQDHFKYLIKPKEWNEQGKDMVLLSSFTPEELEQLAVESAEYFDSLKDRVPRIIAQMPLRKDPAEFHVAAVNEVLRQLAKDGKDPGPWVTHKVRAAVWTRSPEYQKYIAKKYT